MNECLTPKSRKGILYMENFDVVVVGPSLFRVVGRYYAILEAKRQIADFVGLGLPASECRVYFYHADGHDCLGHIELLDGELIQLVDVDSRLLTLKSMLCS